MKYLTLINSKRRIIIDDEDRDICRTYKWRLLKSKYAVSTILPTICIHRLIMRLRKWNNLDIDHINHNTLDNRKQNLRICTRSQNQGHARKLCKTSSTYKGVTWNKSKKKWKVAICINRQKIHLGYFNSEMKAAKAYDKGAKKYFGTFAHTNLKIKVETLKDELLK